MPESMVLSTGHSLDSHDNQNQGDTAEDGDPSSAHDRADHDDSPPTGLALAPSTSSDSGKVSIMDDDALWKALDEDFPFGSPPREYRQREN